MLVKTSELTGKPLDWAVIYLECLRVTSGKPVLARDLVNKAVKNGMASPSKDWAQGGPIIEREGISLEDYRQGFWHARNLSQYRTTGDTPLIAAMRSYVASKLGDTVEIPDELMGS